MDAIETCGLTIAKSSHRVANTTTLVVVFRRKLAFAPYKSRYFGVKSCGGT